MNTGTLHFPLPHWHLPSWHRPHRRGETAHHSKTRAALIVGIILLTIFVPLVPREVSNTAYTNKGPAPSAPRPEQRDGCAAGTTCQKSKVKVDRHAAAAAMVTFLLIKRAYDR